MMDTKSDALEGSLPPGFRFHPTDEELILYYLRNRVTCNPYPISVVSDVDIYKFDPWDLPDQAEYGEREWYFFSPRDRKYPNGARPNRAAGSGYWKATGTDKPIHSGSTFIGVKKALVFYKGRPPKGSKTEWVMHEYRLAADCSSSRPKMGRPKGSSMKLDDWVLCRIYKKKNFDPVMEVEKRDKYRVLDEGPATSFRSTAEDHRQQQQHIEMMKFPRPPSFSTLMHADYYGLLPLSMDRFGYEDLSPFPICDNSATMVGTSNDYQQAMNTMPYQMYHP